MHLFPLLACTTSSASIDVTGIADIGRARSAWWYDGVPIERVFFVGDGAAEAVPGVQLDATIRISTAAGGCAIEQEFFEGWAENSRAFAEVVDTVPGSACDAATEFVEAQDELDARLYAGEHADLSVFYCSTDGQCELEEGEYTVGDQEDYWLSSSLHVFDGEGLAERWDSARCELAESDDDRWAVAEGQLVLGDVDAGEDLPGTLEGTLVDYDAYLDGEGEEEGRVAATFTAESCELDAPEVLVVVY